MGLLGPLKALGRRMLGPVRMGRLDYWRFPARRTSWGGPMNGQAARRKVVEDLLATVAVERIVETGTFRGTTTRWLAGLADVPVHTVEAEPRLHGFARAHLDRLPRVDPHLGDSRAFLRAVVEPGPAPLFAYLDAHWREDLPLAEELAILFERRPAAIAMVDDFEVEDDAGYGYDDYGPGRALDRAYIAPLVARFALGAWYPAASSAAETGARRGCVVLAEDDVHGACLDAVASLRRAPYGRGAPAA